MQKPESVDPELEGARRSAIAMLILVAAGVGVALATVLGMGIHALFLGYSLTPAGWTVVLASFAGVLGALRVVTYRKAYRVATAPRDQREPLKGRIARFGVALELIATLVVLTEFLMH